MSTLMRRRSLLGAGAAVVGLALGAGTKIFSTRVGVSSRSITNVVVNCGFTPRSQKPATLAYGRELRDQLYHDVLAAIERHRGDGYLVQLRAAEEILELATTDADDAHLATLWLSIDGKVGEAHRSRHYVAAVAG